MPPVCLAFFLVWQILSRDSVDLSIVWCAPLAVQFFRLGVLAHFISFSVMTGFTSGAAFIIASSQLQARVCDLVKVVCRSQHVAPSPVTPLPGFDRRLLLPFCLCIL